MSFGSLEWNSQCPREERGCRGSVVRAKGELVTNAHLRERSEMVTRD